LKKKDYKVDQKAVSRTHVLDQILMFRKWVKNIEKDSTLAMNFFLKLKFWKERVKMVWKQLVSEGIW